MPWKHVTSMSQRKEFVSLALTDGANMARLCRRFEISRKTGYKWLARFLVKGESALADRSRPPSHCPRTTPRDLEQAVLHVREAHPAWGGRKIRARLQAQDYLDVPAASAITAILHRHGLIDPAASVKHQAWRRFGAEAPNDLWQMDFKGHFAAAQGRCHPLTVLDDHSRYALGLKVCGNEPTATVRGHLTAIFRRYGLPGKILVDNGPPWGSDTNSHSKGIKMSGLTLGSPTS